MRADLLVPYQLRTIRIAVQTTAILIVLLALYIVLPGRPPLDLVPFAVTLALGVAGMLLVYHLPWRQLFYAGLGQRFLYAWSFADIVLVSAAVAFTGGVESDLWYVYALITVFFAASYPVRGQLGLLAATIVSYIAVLTLVGDPLPPATMLLRVGGLASLAFIAGFLSMELGAQMSQRGESDRRAWRFGAVAAAARSMQVPRPDLMLHTLVDAALQLGFAASAAAERGGDGSWRVAALRGKGALAGALEVRLVEDEGMAGDAAGPSVAVLPVTVDGDVRLRLAVAHASGSPPRPVEHEALELLCGIAARALESSEYAARLHASQERFRALVQHSSDLMIVLDAAGHVTEVSESIEQMLGISPERLAGRRVDAIVIDEATALLDALRDVRLYGGVSEPLIVRLGEREETSRLVEVIATNLLRHPDVRGVVLNGRDVTERQRLAEELEWRRYRSAPTGLLNRAGLIQAAVRWMRERPPGAAISVLFIDLDDFAAVNDLHGRAAGDALIRDVGQRFAEAMPLGLELAHVGGDQFAVLAPQHDVVAALEQAGALLRALEVAFPIGNDVHRVHAVIGVACDASGQLAADQLVEQAEVAAYAAKRSPAEPVAIFDPGRQSERLEQVRLEHDLRRAIDRDELDLVYQPIVHLGSGVITAMEALLRWRHPERGLIPPAAFIPLAEASGLIEPLGAWVARTACMQLAAWHRCGGWMGALRMNINISPLQLIGGRFACQLARWIEEAGLAPDAITLELTEESFAADREELRAEVEALQQLGVRLAIDDFGVGYSALGYLRRFPVDVVKIDRSFVGAIGRGEGDGDLLLDAIFDLAHRMGLRIVAEGVEERAQVDYLRGLECRYVQGYYLSEPVRPEAMAGLPAAVAEALAPAA